MMAGAAFLQVSADTPGVKHLFSPLVLHVGEVAEKIHDVVHVHVQPCLPSIMKDPVHEADLMENYSLLKEYLLAFSDKKLPAAEDQKAAFALLAVTCNLFPKELYDQKGGKKKVKDWANLEGGKLLELARHTVNITYRTVQARNDQVLVLKRIVATQRGLDVSTQSTQGFKTSESTDTLELNAQGLEDPLEKSPDPPGFRRADPFDDDDDEQKEPVAALEKNQQSWMDVVETFPMFEEEVAEEEKPSPEKPKEPTAKTIVPVVVPPSSKSGPMEGPKKVDWCDEVCKLYHEWAPSISKKVVALGPDPFLDFVAHYETIRPNLPSPILPLSIAFHKASDGKDGRVFVTGEELSKPKADQSAKATKSEMERRGALVKSPVELASGSKVLPVQAPNIVKEQAQMRKRVKDAEKAELVAKQKEKERKENEKLERQKEKDAKKAEKAAKQLEKEKQKKQQDGHKEKKEKPKRKAAEVLDEKGGLESKGGEKKRKKDKKTDEGKEQPPSRDQRSTPYKMWKGTPSKINRKQKREQKALQALLKLRQQKTLLPALLDLVEPVDENKMSYTILPKDGCPQGASSILVVLSAEQFCIRSKGDGRIAPDASGRCSISWNKYADLGQSWFHAKQLAGWICDESDTESD